jgi:anti-anti-sigma regulatory factor
LDHRFRPDEPPEPRELVTFWSEATNGALDAGFTGLRAVIDTTPWAQLRHEERSVFLHGEQLLNRYRRDHPCTVICACDASALPVEALAETASVHPQTDGVAPTFKLYSTGPSTLAAQGEIDSFTVPVLGRVLDFVPPVEAGAELVIDAAELTFIDHRCLVTLDLHAQRTGLHGVVLQRASRTTAKVAELLELGRVRVVEATR